MATFAVQGAASVGAAAQRRHRIGPARAAPGEVSPQGASSIAGRAEAASPRLGCAARRSRAVRWSVSVSAQAPAAVPTASPSLMREKLAGKKVVLTREAGKNEQLQTRLEEFGIECIEMPLIEHGPAPDRDKLPASLKEDWEWVIVTSPEAAAVLLEGWREADCPKVRIASVGKGTSRVLEGGGLRPLFTPSKANAETLAAELPCAAGGVGGRVLYPSSAKARKELQEGLRARGCGFEVTRLNTYTTVTVERVEPAILAAAAKSDVVTFGSPSAVKAWVELAGRNSPEAGPAVACIGETSAVASREAGLSRIFFPQQPGIDGWVESVTAALSGGKPAY